MLIGVLQIFAVSKLGRMMFGGKTSEKIIGFVLFILKMAAVIVILYFISTVSLESLVWTAGGVLSGLLAASFYIVKRRRRGAAETRVNGDEGSNG